MRARKIASIPKSLRELPQDMPWEDFASARPEIASAIATSMDLEPWTDLGCPVGFDALPPVPGENGVFSIAPLGEAGGQSARVVALHNLVEAAMRGSAGDRAFYARSGDGLAWVAVLSEGEAGSWLVLHHRE